jgi:DNA mismatch endonuclease (patch repair protein)
VPSRAASASTWQRPSPVELTRLNQCDGFSPHLQKPVAEWRKYGKREPVPNRIASELFRRGLRYRVDFEVLKKPRRVADIAFPGLRIAIFVDGCFWHGRHEHATWPKQNAEFWLKKIETNRHWDADTNDRLRSIGWTVLRFWEHEPAPSATDAIANLVITTRSMQRESPGRSNETN